MTKTFQYDCVSPKSLDELNYIIDNAQEISFKDFADNVDKLPYYDIPLETDWHVSFFKSKLPNGKEVFYYCHSGIEHIYY